MRYISLSLLFMASFALAQSNSYFSAVPSTGFTNYLEKSYTAAEGVIYSYGGYYNNNGWVDINTLVASYDGGRNWTPVNIAAMSTARHSIAMAWHEVNGSKELVFACGERFGGPYYNDVYYEKLENLGPASGQQWTKSTISTGSKGMGALNSLLIGNNRLLVRTLGMTSYGICTNAVYTIADVAIGGWTQQTNGPWSPRFSYGTTTISGGTQLMLVGGLDCAFTTRYNDVYIGSYSIPWGAKVYNSSTVTISWRLVTAAAPFSARNAFAIASRNDLVYIAGGQGVNGNLLNDLWVSPNNGQDWLQIAANAGYTPRFQHFLTAIGQKLVIVGGLCAGNVPCDSATAYEAF